MKVKVTKVREALLKEAAKTAEKKAAEAAEKKAAEAAEKKVAKAAEKKAAKAAEKKAAKAVPAKATPLYTEYISAFNAETTAISTTGEKIELIATTGLTLPEFFTLLWSEKYKVPEQWPLNSSGAPLSPTSSKTRAAMPEVNRLVSALAMRKKRTGTPPKPSEPSEPPKPTKPTEPTEDSGTGANIEAYSKKACIGQLQALLVQSFEVDLVVYNAAKTLVKLLIDQE